MKVSSFSGILPKPTSDKNIFDVLDDIRTGKHSTLIGAIRLEKDKEKRNTLKKKLSGVTFAGTFKHRSISNLKKASGLAILDYDETSADELKAYFKKSNYCFAVWVSPSGNGVKVLVRIPKTDNNQDYGAYVKAIYKHFKDKKEFADTSTIDISRLAFDSYDPEIYVNAESEVFTDRIEPEKYTPITTERIEMPLTDEREIVDRLMVWFRKRFTGTNRNTNLHALARQFNAFGISQSYCETILFQFQQNDFGQIEIQNLIKSAYKYRSENGVAQFNDKKKTKQVSNLLKRKIKPENIAKNTGIDVKKIEAKAEELNENRFWEYSENNSPIIDNFRFCEFLKENNIFKYYPNPFLDDFEFVRKEGNFIDLMPRTQIKDFVLDYLRKENHIDIWNLMSGRPAFFSQENLSMMDRTEIEISRDTKDTAMIYFRNKAVKVSKDNFELIDYDDLSGLVWKKQVIDRDIILNEESRGVYKKFIWCLSGGGETTEDKIARYYSFKSTIGYLLHSYKDRVSNRCIIFNDEKIDDTPNGGSGKGLFHYAIGQIKKLTMIDGKSFNNDSQFKFQKVSQDTQIVCFDDVVKKFNFENLFSVITEDFEIERKGKDKIVIPFEYSPKTTVTTNYTINGDGGSFYRRVFELEMSAFFNETHNPEQEFGHKLFDEWDSEEWANFDNYMLRSLQYYLNEGLKEMPVKNLDLRKLINRTNKEFVDFYKLKEDEIVNVRFEKDTLKQKFLDEYPDFHRSSWFTTTMFNKWLKALCDYTGWGLKKASSNGIRYIELIAADKPKPNDGELPF